MVNIKLGNTTYEEVSKIRFDKSEGGAQEFVLYDDAFEDGRVKGEEEGYQEGYDVGRSDGHVEGFEAGKTEGYAEGKDVGIAEGAQTEYDRFWDAAQNFGKRRGYTRAFASELWTDENFKPKYDIICSGLATNLFYYSQITDIAGILERQNVVMDTSAATGLYAAFHHSKTTRIPEISLLGITPGSNGAEGVFAYATGLTEISRIVLPDEYRFELTGSFVDTKSLTTVNFEGVIWCDIDFRNSPLSATSLNSVITHLSDTATGKTATFKLSAVNAAFETAAGAADGATSQAWLDLVATKPTWTISLV